MAISLRSTIGIYGANFFLTEMIGVIAPFLGVYLRKKGWDYEAVGTAAAISGLGTFLLQIPAGIISDEVSQRRALLGAACLLFGMGYVALPFFTRHAAAVYALLFTTGTLAAFFVPLLVTLALSLAGPKRFDRMMGANEGWSHAGNIAAAALALLSQRLFGLTSVFYTVFVVCILTVTSLCLIRSGELAPIIDHKKEKSNRLANLLALFADKRVIILVASVALFQIANAPAMPLAALYIQHLEGSERHTAWVVLVAQSVMVPVSIIAARLSIRLGRKPVFAFAFIVLPLRLILFSFSTTPLAVILVQGLDGFAAGIYDVIICLLCNDLTRGKAGFNTLLGVMQTTVALGGFAGPLLQGYVTQHLGFPLTFLSLAAIATAGAVVFLAYMPETRVQP